MPKGMVWILNENRNLKPPITQLQSKVYSTIAALGRGKVVQDNTSLHTLLHTCITIFDLPCRDLGQQLLEFTSSSMHSIHSTEKSNQDNTYSRLEGPATSTVSTLKDSDMKCSDVQHNK